MKETLLAAIRQGKIDDVREMLQQAPPLNFIEINSPDKIGWTPLVLAIEGGNYEIVRILLEAGADPNMHVGNGYTPLSVAILDSSAEIAMLLIDSGARIEEENKDGQWNNTPLHYAAWWGRDEIMEELIRRGADPERENLEGLRPLHFAAYGGRPETVRRLLAHGVQAAPHAHMGGKSKPSTPLMLARKSISPEARSVIDILEQISEAEE